MGKQAFELKLEALQSSGVKDLPKALSDKNNFYVGKAARRAAALNATDLIDPLVNAFHRFLEGGAEADPKCWAKVDIILALYELGYREPALYQQAFRCIQLESVWGGQEDCATIVRAQAVLALVDCNLDPIQLLRTLLPGLGDKAKNVRIETIRALTRLGRWEGELLIRQKLLLGDADPEVLGNGFSAILELDQQGAIQFVVEFLDSTDEATQLEAAASLAQSRHQEAFDAVASRWPGILTRDLRRTIAIGLGASPLDAARDLLLDILQNDQPETSACALTALASGRHRETLRSTVEQIVKDRADRQLTQAFREEFN